MPEIKDPTEVRLVIRCKPETRKAWRHVAADFNSYEEALALCIRQYEQIKGKQKFY